MILVFHLGILWYLICTLLRVREQRVSGMGCCQQYVGNVRVENSQHDVWIHTYFLDS